MVKDRLETLPGILAELKALATDLAPERQAADDGIPVLTTPLASPARPDLPTRATSAPVPTLTAVVATPKRAPRAAAIAARVAEIWRAEGHPPLDPAIIAALERALIEALHPAP